jgi:ribonucleoside-diphosphate reductase alpha chain
MTSKVIQKHSTFHRCIKDGKTEWLIIIRLDQGMPIAIYSIENKLNFKPNFSHEGFIIETINEVGETEYDFEFINDDGSNTVIKSITSTNHIEYDNYCLFISALLKNKIPIEQIVTTLNSLLGFENMIMTWNRGVIRLLKTFIPYGTKIEGAVCPECGAKKLIYVEGCAACENCGYSRCS